MNDILQKSTIRSEIQNLENAIRKHPEAIAGDNPLLPLKHTFGDGIYIRDLSIPKGMLVVGKIHKKRTLNMLLKGEITILTEDGIKRIKAPFYFIAPPGNKKVGYTHEDTIWLNILATNETDLDKIEEEFIAKDFKEIENKIIDIEVENFFKEVSKMESL